MKAAIAAKPNFSINMSTNNGLNSGTEPENVNIVQQALLRVCILNPVRLYEVPKRKLCPSAEEAKEFLACLTRTEASHDVGIWV